MNQKESKEAIITDDKINILYQDAPCQITFGKTCVEWQAMGNCLGSFPLIKNYNILVENNQNKQVHVPKSMGKGMYSVIIKVAKKENGATINVPLETIPAKKSFRIISKRGTFYRIFNEIAATKKLKLTDKQKVTLSGRLKSIQHRFDSDRVAYGEECSNFLDDVRNEYDRLKNYKFEKTSLDKFKGAIKLYFPKFKVEMMTLLMAYSLQIKFKNKSNYAWPLTVGDAGSQKTTMYDITFGNTPMKYVLQVDMSTEAGIFSARDKKRLSKENNEDKEIDVDTYDSIAILASGKNLINRDIFHFLAGRKDEARRKMGLLQMLYDAQNSPVMASFGTSLKKQKRLQPMVFMSSCTSKYFATEFQDFRMLGERFSTLAFYFEDQLLGQTKDEEGVEIPLFGGEIVNMSSEIREKLKNTGKDVFMTLHDSDITLASIPDDIKKLINRLFKIIVAAKSDVYGVADFTQSRGAIRGKPETNFVLRIYSAIQGKDSVDLEDFKILRFLLLGAFKDQAISLAYVLIQLLQLEMEKQDKEEFTVKDLRLFAGTIVGNLDYRRHVYYLNKYGILEETVQEDEDDDGVYFPENGFKAHENHVNKELQKIYKRSYKISYKFKLNEMFDDLYKEFKKVRTAQFGEGEFQFSDDLSDGELAEDSDDSDFFEESDEE